ncbi:Galectin-3 [Armadillidium nasatum]|uniref:Galectin n=1 Tax=Armadillidium nasatum TaxID=96803 RepID=A0A5N5STL7_9CRUS|nr:Galectin-3 [Armadillidium nasatum]
MTDPIYNPGQPYLLVIPGGFTPGKIIHLTGVFQPSATSLVLKIQSGSFGDPNDEIGLCIYARLNERIFGMNAFTRATGWGQEETLPIYNFVQGQPFELTILGDPYQFKGMAPSAHHNGKGSKGLLGMVGSAGAAVAGALGASHLLGKSKGYPSSGGYPGSQTQYGGYPASQPQYGGYSGGQPQYGGYPGGHKSGSGGILNKAMGVGGGILGAKAMGKGLGGLGGGLGGSKALKYGLPLAGAGVGGYMLSKGIGNSFSFRWIIF